MSPISVAAPASHPVDMLVVTNRVPSADPTTLYTSERDLQLHINRVVVLIPPDDHREIGKIQWPKNTHPDPNTDFVTQTATPLTVDETHKWFKEIGIKNNGHLLIFVHGYNTPFDGGVYLFAQIVHDSKMEVAPLLFSWPSKGDLLAYDYDRESATYSRTALSEIIQEALASEDVHEITILGHSMGSWITMEALRTLTLKGVDVTGKLHNVILASPDIDVNVFYSQFQDLGIVTPKITLIISRDDKALQASRIIGGNVDRLGAIDITQKPYASTTAPPNIQIIDISTIDASDRSNHLKFSESPDIVKLLGASLVNGQALSNTETSLNEAIGIIIIKQESNILKIIRK